MTESAETPHHRHLEQSRSQVIELLTRQAVERELLLRSEGGDRQELVEQLVARQQLAALAQRLDQFHPADIAFVLESLTREAREMAWEMVRPERRGAVLIETTEGVRRALIGGLRAEEIATLVQPLESDEIADLLADLPEETRQEVLGKLDRSEQAEVRSVLSFPDGTVGAIMYLDFISVREDASLEAVLRLLRRRKELPPDTDELIVIDRNNKLCGVLPIEKLLLSQPEQSVSEVMTREPTYFFTEDAVRDAVDSFEKYDLISTPVVNLHKQVVGRLTIDVVLDAVQERAQSEPLRQVGLSEDEDMFAPTLQSARNRWPWLALNLCTAFVASRVIGAFEGVIEQLVALATLMPIIASIGGNTGNQTMALVIRGLAMNQMGPAQLRVLLGKELAIAAINGAVWGAALAMVTLLLYHEFALALVIGVAMLLELVLAASAGLVIPVLLQRFGRDPVMGSSVILTAVTDSMGFFIFLGLAAAVLV